MNTGVSRSHIRSTLLSIHNCIVQYELVFHRLRLQRNSDLSLILKKLYSSEPAKNIAIQICTLGKVVNNYIGENIENIHRGENSEHIHPFLHKRQVCPTKVGLSRPLIEETDQIDAMYCVITIIPHTAQFISGAYCLSENLQ